MTISRPEDVTQAVPAVMERTREPWLREIVVALVKHLCGFMRETPLTEAWFGTAMALPNEMWRLEWGLTLKSVQIEVACGQWFREDLIIEALSPSETSSYRIHRTSICTLFSLVSVNRGFF
jgi:hypothetical protein